MGVHDSRVRSRGLAACLVVVVLAGTILAAGQTSAQAATAPKAARAAHLTVTAHKTKGGTTPPFPATGYFTTGQLNGHWYLVTPQGEPFYSSAVDTVSPNGDTDQVTGQCPYCQTVASDYPNTAAWATATVAQLRSWGVNSLGPYSDYNLLGSQMPFTVQLAMASGDDWFAPSFVTNADQVAATQIAPLADNPNVIGYYTDSELNWGPPEDNGDTLTVLQEYENLPVGSPGYDEAQLYANPPDPDGFLTALATRYFSVTTAAVRQYDPNHLILGVKAEGQEIQPQLFQAAAPYVNVFSVNDYTLQPGLAQVIDDVWPYYLPVQPNLADFYASEPAGDQIPIMIGEYTTLGPASALTPNTDPGVYATAATQTARATAWSDFIAPLYEDAPWMVGDDWFEYVDEPAGGRTGDGENSNFGLINVDGQPYTPLVDQMSVMHSIAPDRLVTTGPTCDSWADGTSGVTCTATMPVASYPVSIDDAPLAGATQATAYSQTVYAGGGTGSYKFSIAQGSLPKGLKIGKTTGIIAGTPTVAGTASFTVQATDPAGSVGTEALSIAVAPDTPVTVKTTSLAKAKVGVAYSKTLAATGGTAPYSWSVSAGSLPAGLSLASNGTVSGTATASGTSTFTVEVTDSSTPTKTATAALSLVVK